MRASRSAPRSAADARGSAARIGVALLALGATSIGVAPSVATATSAALVPRGCVDDPDRGYDSCAHTAAGLYGAHSVGVSPDGASVYAAGEGDSAVVHLQRNPATGALAPAGCVSDDGGGDPGCDHSAVGLDGVDSVAVSPDGTSVYAASLDDDAIVRFDRDITTGELVPEGCVSDHDTGDPGCGQSAAGLDEPVSVTVSPDGESVYAASFTDDAVVRFDRDPGGGALTPEGCIDDDPPEGPDGCATSADGLGGASAVTVSPDGRSAYVAAFRDSSVTRFDRDPTTGALTAAGCVDDHDEGHAACARTTPGLDAAISVAVSPDGRSLYATGIHDDAIVRFDRDTATGALTPEDCVDDGRTGDDTCARSRNGLNGAHSVAITPDGRSVLVASTYDVAVLGFDRDPSTGELAPEGCVNDNDTGDDTCAARMDGLGGPTQVAITPDGRSAYAASVFDSAIATLELTAVAPPAAHQRPSNLLVLGGLHRNKRRGTARLVVHVPGAGLLQLARTRRVRTASARADAAGARKLRIRPRRRARSRLRARGRAHVRAIVTFTPVGGEARTESTRFRLVKRGRHRRR